MSHELNLENILIQVRDCLNTNQIKLWQEPYFVNNHPNESEIETLGRNFSVHLSFPLDVILSALNELQHHSLDKLKLIEIFKEQGIASLKIRIPDKATGTRTINVQIKLTENVQKLQEIVAEKLETRAEKIKLISTGKVLNTNQTLEAQGIKNLQQILALRLEQTAKDAQEESDIYERIQKIRSEAEVLLKSKQDQFFHLENQSGETVYVPENEKRALILALLLHEKGKVKLKAENFNEALIFFLEADREISACNSSLVQSIDNYAILNLDIVWCYLCLKSIMQLPDAERRLQICEQSFKRSYGENFSRLAELKGNTENEKTLIMRLHLLQGVLFFHQNRRSEASALLSVAERELSSLKVNDNQVQMMIEMGYTRSESVTGLRASQNCVDGAVSFVLDRRQKLQESRAAGKKERQLKKCLGDLGLNENDFNLRTLNMLTEMGFQKEMCALALKKCGNDVAGAISMLQEKQAELSTELSTMVKPKKDFIDQLMTIGFDEELSKNILKITNNNLEAAIESLLQLQNEGAANIPDQLLNLIDQSMPSTSSESASSSSSENKLEQLKDKIKNSLDEQKAFDSIKEDIDGTEDDEYLCISLDQEENLLKQYKKILS